MSDKSLQDSEHQFYHQREKVEGKGKNLPELYQNPTFVRGDSRVCPQALSGDAYQGCANRCTFCFCRELESTMMSAYFDNWTPNLVRPADMKHYEKLLALAYSDKKTTNLVAVGIRKGIAFNLGSRAELFQEKEFETETTLKILKLFREYDHPVIIQTKAQWAGLDKYTSILSDMKIAINVSIIGGGNIELLKLEPKAPPADQRYRLVKYLNELGIWTGVRWEPILPTINDDEKTLLNYARRAENNLAKHISWYNYRTSRRPMGKKLMEDAGFNYEKMWAANKDENWEAIGKRVIKSFNEYSVPHSTPDWINFPFDSHKISCCGIDDLFPKGYNKFTFQYACHILKTKGEVRFKHLVEADQTLYDEKEFELMKHLWNDVDEHFFGMRDLYDRFHIDYGGEDNEGNAIWKIKRDKSDLLSFL
jgi:DNA repair photolyase